MKVAKHDIISDIILQWVKIIFYITALFCMLNVTITLCKEQPIDNEKEQLEKDLLKEQIKSFEWDRRNW